jgi:hypothetical protein
VEEQPASNAATPSSREGTTDNLTLAITGTFWNRAT